VVVVPIPCIASIVCGQRLREFYLAERVGQMLTAKFSIPSALHRRTTSMTSPMTGPMFYSMAANLASGVPDFG